MKRKMIVIGLLLGTLPCLGVKPIPGGWADVPVGKKEVRNAAAFAVTAQAGDGHKLELVNILKAGQQIVSGIKYRITLQVKVGGKQKQADTTVWSQPWKKEKPYQLLSWKWREDAAEDKVMKKIGLDLSQLDADGLRGPADGKVAVSYEFKIPDTKANRAQVKATDPSVKFMRGSAGRVEGNGLLCIGSTHQKNHQEILRRLAGLPYVKHIAQCFFE